MRCKASVFLAFLLLLFPISAGTVLAISPAPDQSHPYITTMSITEAKDLSWIDNASFVSSHDRYLIHGSLTGSYNAGGEVISKINGMGVILEKDSGDEWSNPIQLAFSPDVISPSSNSSVFIHGVFDSSLSIDQTIHNAEGPALYLAAMDHTSGLIWSHIIEDQGSSPELLSLIPTSDGGVVGVGEFRHERSLSDTYIFTPDGQSTGGISSASEIMAFKISQNGSLEWSTTFGSDLDESILAATPTSEGAALLIHHTSSFSGSTPPARNGTFGQHTLPSEEGIVSFIIDSDDGLIDVAPWAMTNITHLSTHPLGLLGVGQGNADGLGCTDERSSPSLNGDPSLTWFTILLTDEGQCLWSNHVLGYIPFEMVDVDVADSGRSFLQFNIGELGQVPPPKMTTLNDISISHAEGRDTVVLTLEPDGHWSSYLHLGESASDDVGLGIMVGNDHTLFLHVDARLTVLGTIHAGEQLLMVESTFESPTFDIVFQRDGVPLEAMNWSSGPIDLLITSHNHSGPFTITSNLTEIIWSSPYVVDGDQTIVTAQFPVGPQQICVHSSSSSPTCVNVIHEPEPFMFNIVGSSALFPSGDGGLRLTFPFVAVGSLPQIDPGGVEGQTTYTIESTTLDRYLVNVTYLVYAGGISRFCVTASVEGHPSIERCQDATIESSLMDSDVDGVVDQDDLCPETPVTNTIVSQTGCSTAQLAALEEAAASSSAVGDEPTSSLSVQIDSGSTPILTIILVLLAAVAVVVVSSAPVIIQMLKDQGDDTPEQTDDS